jgi:hypothetical protein
MTKAIVMNTLTGAVTEYDNFGFQSITPTLAGNATGLYALGGNLDIDQPIVGSVVTGKTLWSDLKKKFLDAVHFAMKGSGTSELKVVTESTSYSYPFPVRAAGVSRAKPGRGIRENYLAFGYSNADGADFQLDAIEVPQQPSKNRKV